MPAKIDAAEPLIKLSFKDDRYRTDVAAAGKVYRQYRGRRSWFSDLLLTRGRSRYRRAVAGRRGTRPGALHIIEARRGARFPPFPCELLVTGPRPIGSGGWPVRPQR